MIKHFLYIWSVYWITVIVLPVTSVYTEVLSAFFLQLLFVVLVLGGYSWFWTTSNFGSPPIWGQFSPQNLRWMIHFSIWLSVVGTSCLIYDKIAIQGIDYSQGVAVAREEWRKQGVAREGGISSIFSVFGYLLSSGYFVAAILLVFGGNRLKKSMRYRVLVMVFLLLMLNSVLAGGRSNVLLLAVFVAGTITSVTGWSYKELFSSKFLRSLVVLFLLASFSYLLYVFSERAEATGIDAAAYVERFLPYLGLETSPWFGDWLSSGLVSGVVSHLVLAASYISHSFATTAAIFDHGLGDKTIVFLHPMNILHKLNVVGRPDSSWFLAGRFPSLPGALFYQFGAFGFAVTSLFIGFLCALANHLYLERPASILMLNFYLMMYSVLAISPILLAVDFMSFPFVFTAFILVCFSNWVIAFFRETVRQ